jgi:hypothetical protein
MQVTTQEAAVAPPDDTSDEAIQYLTVAERGALILQPCDWPTSARPSAAAGDLPQQRTQRTVAL